MQENLIKCKVKTVNGLIVECELSHDTINELKKQSLIVFK